MFIYAFHNRVDVMSLNQRKFFKIMNYLTKSDLKIVILIQNLFRLTVSKHKDALFFSLFASFLCGIYKGVLCAMRRFSKDDGLNAIVAGGLSALALLFDDKKRRTFLALVFLSRCLVSIAQ